MNADGRRAQPKPVFRIGKRIRGEQRWLKAARPAVEWGRQPEALTYPSIRAARRVLMKLPQSERQAAVVASGN